LEEFIHLYRGYSRMGFSRYPMFHLYCAVGYALGEGKFDMMTRFVRGILGRSPQFSSVR
jgi:hypothetical protein